MEKKNPQSQSAVEFYQPFDPKTIADPYPYYHEMRTRQPVYFSPVLNLWLATRHEDVALVLKDVRFDSRGRVDRFLRNFDANQKVRLMELKNSFAHWALFMDPPAHTRLRRLLNQTFTQTVANKLRASVTEIVRELLEKGAKEKEFDLVSTLAEPLPVRVIAALLGMPASDAPLLKRWSDDIASFIARIGASFEKAERAQESVLEMSAYIRALMAKRLREPKEDIVSRLAALTQQADGLTDDEALSTTIMLLFGGHETTTNLIGNATIGLMRFRGEWERFCGGEVAPAQAVEEILRYDNAVQWVSRRAAQSVVLCDKVIPEGEYVLCLIGAANRDPKVFSDPDVLDLNRPNAKMHLSLGQGIHFCLGAPLARVELEICFTELARRFPRLMLSEKSIEWKKEAGLRGPKELWVRT